MADIEIKRRRRTTKQELAILEDLFRSNPNPPKAERARVCQLIDMPPRKLQVWLQNRRQKEKKDAEKWKPASYTSEGVKLEEATSSVPCAPCSSSSSSSACEDASTPPPSSSAIPSSSAKPPTLRLPPLAVAIGNTDADASLSLASPAPLSTSETLSARSYSLPLPPVSAPPSQTVFSHAMTRTLTDPPRSAIAGSFPPSIYDRPLLKRSDSSLSLSSTKDGRAAMFGQSIQLPSLSITTCGNAGLTVAAAEGGEKSAIISPVDELLSKLQSDPVEPELHDRQQEMQSVMSPIRRRGSVRMEDILGSHRKQQQQQREADSASKQDNRILHTRAPLGRAYTAPQPLTLPTSAIPFPSSTGRTVLGNSTALSLSRSNSNTSSYADSTGSRKKRTYSYANASILQRSISYDSLQANKENIHPSSYSSSMYDDTPTWDSHLHLGVQTRPMLSRSRSYQDRTTSSTSASMLVKKQRTAVSLHSSESGSDFDELEDDATNAGEGEGDEPDLTFSTIASSTKKDRSARYSETEASDSEYENGTGSLSTSFSSSFTSSLGTSFLASSSAARSTHATLANTLAPIRGPSIGSKGRVYGNAKAGNENQKILSPRKAGEDVGSEDDEDMSREEVDCAAVLLGFGRV